MADKNVRDVMLTLEHDIWAHKKGTKTSTIQ